VRIALYVALGILWVPKATAGDVSFADDVLPVLNRHCVICHMPGSEQGDLSLYPDAHSSMVGVPSSQSPLSLVVPGSVENSYLFRKLVGTQEAAGGTGASMPFQSPLLEASQIELVRRWIERGAQND
jgi:hypothetical protein